MIPPCDCWGCKWGLTTYIISCCVGAALPLIVVWCGRARRRAQARAYEWKKRGGHPEGDFALPRRYRRGGVAHKRWGRFESLQRPDEVHPVRVSGVE